MPAAMLRGQRQPHQAAHRTISTQHRVTQVEQRVRAPKQAAVQRLPERRQRPEFTTRTRIMHTDHGSPCLQSRFPKKS